MTGGAGPSENNGHSFARSPSLSCPGSCGDRIATAVSVTAVRLESRRRVFKRPKAKAKRAIAPIRSAPPFARVERERAPPVVVTSALTLYAPPTPQDRVHHADIALTSWASLPVTTAAPHVGFGSPPGCVRALNPSRTTHPARISLCRTSKLQCSGQLLALWLPGAGNHRVNGQSATAMLSL